ncbi:MAG: DNA polymerase IV, partial [Bacilli bacterium]|nr:DNA polymerase IV [Bacilli bacterium]
MAKVIVHIDLNAFFVRAEELKDPSIENTAVAVGHIGRGGIVSTCSYEARKFGVRSGMPMNKALTLCPHLKVINPDFHFYRALSHEFRNFISNYTKKVEIASIDELYADFTEVIKKEKDVEGFFRTLQQNLYKQTGLKCSIGVAPTKFLAKMGSDYQKPMGLTIIRRKDIAKILYPLPIEDMFGVGKKTAPRLKTMGIKTIGDLANALNNNNEDILNILGKFSDELKLWINGYGSDEIITEYEDPKSIGNSTTLKEDTDRYEEIKEVFEMI